MVITMYRDTASHYGLCEDDGRDENSVTLDVPENTLRDFYNDTIAAYYKDPHTFETWISDIYTLDDVEDLLEYIKDTEGNLNNVKIKEEVE